MDIYEVVVKLVGKIEPVGETNEDNRRYENLKVVTALVDKLLSDIDSVAREKNRKEFSINRAAQFADKFLDSIDIVQ